MAAAALPEAELVDVHFGFVSADQARANSVVQLNRSTLSTNKGPAPWALNDPRMGVVSRRLKCATCHNGMVPCPGHYGTIELPIPTININFHDYVIQVLHCVCWCCSALLLRGTVVPEEHRGIKRLDWLQKVCRAAQSRKSDDVRMRCPDCDIAQPAYNTATGKPEWRRKDLLGLEPELQTLAQAPFTTLVVQAILRGITDEDTRAMGFSPPESHPEAMVMDVLLVPPPIIRPSVSAQDGGKRRGQNDLTTRLREVVKVAAKLEALMAERELTPAERTKGAADLYLAVNSYLNPDKKRVKGVTPTKSAAAHGHGATGKSLSARFKVRPQKYLFQVGLCAFAVGGCLGGGCRGGVWGGGVRCSGCTRSNQCGSHAFTAYTGPLRSNPSSSSASNSYAGSIRPFDTHAPPLTHPHPHPGQGGDYHTQHGHGQAERLHGAHGHCPGARAERQRGGRAAVHLQHPDRARAGHQLQPGDAPALCDTRSGCGQRGRPHC